VKQNSSLVPADIEVRKPVVIVVADGASQKVAVKGIQSGAVRNVLEVAVPVSPIQCEPGANQQNVEISVAIEVEERASVANGLEYVERPLAGDLPAIIDSRSLSNIAKVDGWMDRCFGWSARFGR
jgi:hypothetical protein